MTAYLIQRQACEDGEIMTTQFDTDSGSRVPLKLFLNRAEAEAACAERLTIAYSTINPFIIYEHLANELETGHLAERLTLIGLSDPPPLDRYDEDDWPAWWDQYQDRMDNDQRAAVFQLFDKRPLFEVIEIELEE